MPRTKAIVGIEEIAGLMKGLRLARQQSPFFTMVIRGEWLVSFDYAIVIHSIHSMLKNSIHSIQKLMNGPTSFWYSFDSFFRWEEGRCSRKLDRLFRFFDPLSRHSTEAKRRVRILRKMQTVSKSETFLATESVKWAPFKRGETEVQIFGKEKCKTHSQFQRW